MALNTLLDIQAHGPWPPCKQSLTRCSVRKEEKTYWIVSGINMRESSTRRMQREADKLKRNLRSKDRDSANLKVISCRPKNPSPVDSRHRASDQEKGRPPPASRRPRSGKAG